MTSRALSTSCRPPWPSSGVALGVGNGYYPEHPAKTRQARKTRDQRPDGRVCVCARAGHMHVLQAHTHTCTYHRQLPGHRQTDSCCAVPCCTLLCVVPVCCAVMWLHPLSASPVLSTGASLLAADPVSHVTPLLDPRSRCLPICQPALPALSIVDPVETVSELLSLSLSRPQDELIQQWQAVGEKACQSGPAVNPSQPRSTPAVL